MTKLTVTFRNFESAPGTEWLSDYRVTECTLTGDILIGGVEDG